MAQELRIVLLPPKETARQFLDRFPKSERMGNAMKDLACHQCGQRETLHIRVSGLSSITDSGTFDEGNPEWDDDSACTCQKCGAGGTVRDFTYPGLDDLIAGLETV